MTLDEAIKNMETIAKGHQLAIDTGIIFSDTPIELNPKLRMLARMNIEAKNERIANYKRLAEEHRQLAEWLKELKQLREQTEWITVSKRLPKTADVYRVTRYYPNNVMNPKYLVDACCFDGSNTWYNDNRINHERDYANNVIAWQENPEPYEPQERSEE